MRKTTLSAISIAALSFSLGVAGCGADDAKEATDAASNAASNAATAAGDAASNAADGATDAASNAADAAGEAAGEAKDAMTGADKDIVDTAVAAGDFKKLASALGSAELVETLKGDGPFTVFAPTDAAFDKLPADTIQKMIDSPEPDLGKLLKYHVVSGNVMASDLSDGQKVKTVAGNEITVHVEGDKVTLTDAKGGKSAVTKADIKAKNGVIHVIDTVLMP